MDHFAERQNNFDFLRLLFASLVIVSHSYILTGNPELLSQMTNGQVTFGALAVDVFFIMSGYLILTSLKFSKSLHSYFWKRFLRLFPGLFVLLVFSLVLIVIVYTGKNIFGENAFWTYLPNNLSLYRVQYFVNDVFENNTYPRAINGSLWSLSYEFTMYLFIGLLFPFKDSKLVPWLLLGCFIVSMLLYNFNPGFLNGVFSKIRLESTQAYRLGGCFLSGSLLTFINTDKINKMGFKWMLFAIVLVSIWLNAYKMIAPLILPFLIILTGLSFSKALDYIPSKLGDISYGVYIYGFLIQQTLLHYFKLNSLWLTVISLSITYLLSYFSWHYIEKKCLRYKRLL